jgi:hypothetical protein
MTTASIGAESKSRGENSSENKKLANHFSFLVEIVRRANRSVVKPPVDLEGTHRTEFGKLVSGLSNEPGS